MPNSVFISEEGWFQQPYNYSNKPSSGIPAILAWAIVSDVLPFKSNPRDGNATCPTDLGSTGTSCHSSYSTCRYLDRRYDKTTGTWPALYHSPDTPTDDLSVKAVIPTDYQLV